jgi:two-component system sensor kinase FixL
VPERTDALFSALIATAVDGIIVIDAGGMVQVYNGACERLFGYSPEEVIGQNVKILMPEPYHGEHDGYLSHHRRTGEKRIIGIGREVVGRRKDHSTFPMYLSVGEGELSGQRIFVGIIHDLTERNAAGDEVREREARLSSILDTVPDAIVTIDEMGVIESFSPAATHMFGYPPAEVVGKNIKMLMPQPYHDQHDGYLANYRNTGIKKIIGIGRIVVGQRRDGSTFPIELSVGEVRAGRRRLFTGFIRDITEMQGTEQRLQELQAELLHVSRLSAMGHMSSAIAHELNQPLTAITNYVKAARRTLDDVVGERVSRAQELMDKAAAQVLRAGAIIRNLREFIEKRESTRAPENLSKVIEEAVALGFVGTAHLNVRVRLNMDHTVGAVLIDRIQIQQVFINLIRNAIEAMQAVNTRELTIITSADSPGFVSVIVRDTGPGLAPEIRERLFRPFTTTKEKGLGIGLTICQSIIEAHGGSMTLLPNEGTGTAFRFQLPLVPTAEVAP